MSRVKDVEKALGVYVADEELARASEAHVALRKSTGAKTPEVSLGGQESAKGR